MIAKAGAVYVPIWIAVILTIGTVVGTIGTPVALRVLDWKRQDEVAKKVALAAEEVSKTAKQAAQAAALLVESNATVAAANKETHDQLRIIHTLVNSTLTAALKAELGATVRELASLNEIVDLKRATGHEPTKEALVAIETCKARIGELQANLSDRARQQAIVESQAEK